MTNKHMKRCSTSLVTGEMKTKTTVRYRLIPIRTALSKKQKITSVGKDVEKLVLLYPVDWNVKWYSC